jgi:hypothetical protein
MILKQVLHYPGTNSVEATWLDEKDITVKCHSYADVQMDMLRADLGADAADLIATVEANIKPVVVVPPTPLEQLAQLDATNALTQRNKRWATAICQSLLDPFDPRGAHCT